MPYKKKYVPKRKKTYRRRFKDSKINTKIERKINQISKKNDAKNRELLVRASPYGTVNTNQQSSQYDFTQLATNGNLGDTVDTGLDILNLTAVGGSQYNSIIPKGDAVETNVKYAKYFRFTKAQIFLQFFTLNTFPTKIRVSLIYIPNASAYTAGASVASGITTVLKPNKQICGIVDMRKKGIFKKNALNSLTDYSNMKYTMLASKQITLQPPRATGISSDPYPEDAQAKNFKEINISYNFKGLGKRLVYNAGTSVSTRAAMSNGNIYVVIAHDTHHSLPLPYVKGIAGVQYYLEKPSTQSWNN